MKWLDKNNRVTFFEICEVIGQKKSCDILWDLWNDWTKTIMWHSWDLKNYVSVMSYSLIVLSEWVIVVYCQMTNFSAISWREQVTFQWDDNDDVCFVLDQHA